MKKTLKKLSILALAVVMVLTVAIPALAANSAHETLSGAPAKTDKATVKVYDVEPGLTVTAYKIIEATYDDTDKNFRGFAAIQGLQYGQDTDGNGTIDNDLDGNDIVDLQDPTSEEITKIAQKINKETINPEKTTLTESNGVYSADLTPGYYIIKVSGLTKDNEKIYNPMLAGVYYGVDENGEIKTVDTMIEYETKDKANTKDREYVLYDKATIADADGNVDPTQYVHVDSDPADKYRKIVKLSDDQIDAGYPTANGDASYWNLSGTDLYAKSSPVEVEKTVYQNIDEDVATNQDTNKKTGDNKADTNDKHGDHHDIGDTVTFHAVADIPDYSDEYDELVYKITDTLEKDKLAFRDANGGTTPKIKVYIGTKNDVANFNSLTNLGNSYREMEAGDLVYTGNEKLTLTFNGDNEFVLELNEAAIRAHGGEKIFLEYYAELLEGADQNFNENTNEIEVEFTNEVSPDDGGKPKTTTKKDITFHYTFELDGQLDSEDHENGGTKSGSQSGHELAKVNEFFDEKADRSITYTKQDGTQGTATFDPATGKYMDNGVVAIDWDKPEFHEDSWTKTTIKNGLEGAEFTLTPYLIKDDDTVPADPSNVNTKAQTNNADNLKTTTNDGGRINFKGLDAGYYVMEETKAPAGYSKNPNKTVVFIDAEFYGQNEYFDGTYTPEDTDYPGVDYDYVDENGTKVCKQIKFHKGELKNYEVKRAQLTPEEFDKVKGDLSKTTWTEETKYVETRTSNNGVVDYGVTTTVTGAASTFIQNTKVPVLPSTGGIGTYLFTIAGVILLGIASFLLINRRRKAKNS